jgi:hypothetical protein
MVQCFQSLRLSLQRVERRALSATGSTANDTTRFDTFMAEATGKGMMWVESLEYVINKARAN